MSYSDDRLAVIAMIEKADHRLWPRQAAQLTEVMTVRSEDKNARQVQQGFAAGATLAELEQHIAYLRSLGAPDNAHPRVGVNEDYEITVMICVVQRPAPQATSAS